MLLRFVVPVDVEETSDSAPNDKTQAIISSFTTLDEHYTYTLDRYVNDEDDDDDDDGDEEDTDEEDTDEEDPDNENEEEDLDNEEG
jgi:ribonuclease E